MRLILVRHGESEGNAGRIVQGNLDFGLTVVGQRQAAATAQALAGTRVDRLLSSPLRRAAQTAEWISEATGAPVEAEPRLREYDIGHLAGLTFEQISERYPEIDAAYRRGERPSFPGEEGRDIFYQRLLALLDHYRTADETIVAVGHGGVVSAICYTVAGLDHHRPGIFQVANCSITEIRADRAGRLVIDRHNDTCHLDGMVTVEDMD